MTLLGMCRGLCTTKLLIYAGTVFAFVASLLWRYHDYPQFAVPVQTVPTLLTALTPDTCRSGYFRLPNMTKCHELLTCNEIKSDVKLLDVIGAGAVKRVCVCVYLFF